ncbi:43621_t:CDS:1, partial [Gigaspora margarita]
EQIIMLKIGIKDKEPKGKGIPKMGKSGNSPIKPPGIPTTPQVPITNK